MTCFETLFSSFFTAFPGDVKRTKGTNGGHFSISIRWEFSPDPFWRFLFGNDSFKQKALSFLTAPVKAPFRSNGVL
jgi:hypothetical protein